MKKLFATLAAVALTAVSAVAFAACGSGEKVSVKDIELTSEEYAFAIKKENTQLLEDVNAMIAEWKADGSLDELINSYFDGTADFSYTNKTAEAQEGDFIMVTSPDFPPFEHSTDNKTFTGIDIEIAYNIAQELDRNLFIMSSGFDFIIANIQNGKGDIGMAGMTVTDERLEQVSFATGYYSSAQVITVRERDTTFDECKSVADVEAILKAKGKDYTVGTQIGTTGKMYCEDELTNLTYKEYDSGALAMQDLSNGKIDAVILDKQPSLMIAKSINK